MSNYLTIGIYREDGDFDVFATLNNETFALDPQVMTQIVELLMGAIDDGVVLHRQDAPDVVDPDGKTIEITLTNAAGEVFEGRLSQTEVPNA